MEWLRSWCPLAVAFMPPCEWQKLSGELMRCAALALVRDSRRTRKPADIRGLSCSTTVTHQCKGGTAHQLAAQLLPLARGHEGDRQRTP